MYLLIFCSLPSKSFSLYISHKTTSWVTWSCSTLFAGKMVMVYFIHHRQQYHQNSYIIWWNKSFSNSIVLPILYKSISSFEHLLFFFKLFYWSARVFWALNSWILCHLPPVVCESLIFVIFRMLRMLAIKHIE